MNTIGSLRSGEAENHLASSDGLWRLKANMETQSERSRVGTITYFDFKCPGCEAEGNLGIDIKDRGQVLCPEGCGASFILWRDGDVWKLTCVVKPMGLATICPACKDPLLEDEDQTASPYHITCQYSELDA
jgi:hypothetical protein